MKLIEDSEIIDKILYDGFLDYQTYAELNLLSPSSEDSYCYRCEKSLTPLTYLEKDFCYLPCWDCASKRKADRQIITEGIIANIKDYYFNKILGDRYLQLFIIDNIYFKNTLPHDFYTFKKIISSLDPPSRNDIWFLDWIPGYPKIISLDNLQGIKLVNLTNIYKDKIVSGKDKIIIGDYTVEPPEIVNYDAKHLSRYSIFNKNGYRKTKRIKIGDKCIKFYNTFDETKSIFRLTKNGEPVTLNSIPYQDFIIIKLAIMRNKTFLKLIFDIVLDIVKFSGTFRDSVFLKNTIKIDPKKDTVFNLIWTSISDNKNDNYINLSIL